MFLLSILLGLNLASADGLRCQSIMHRHPLGNLALKIHGSDYRFIPDSSFVVTVERFVGSTYKMRLRSLDSQTGESVQLAEAPAHVGMVDAPYLIGVHPMANSAIVVSRGGIEVVDLKTGDFVKNQSRKLMAAIYSELQILEPENFQTFRPSASLRLRTKNSGDDYLMIGTRDNTGVLLDNAASVQKAYILVLDLKGQEVVNRVEIDHADQISKIEPAEMTGKFKVTYKVRGPDRRLVEHVTEIAIDISAR